MEKRTLRQNYLPTNAPSFRDFGLNYGTFILSTNVITYSLDAFFLKHEYMKANNIKR